MSNIIHNSQEFLAFIRDQALPSGNLSIRGVARCCDVPHTSIIRDGAFKSEKLAQILTQYGFEAGALISEGFSPEAVWLTIEYFAYYSKAKAPMAKQLARTFGAIGIKHTLEQLSGASATPSKEGQVVTTSFEVLVRATEVLPTIANPIIKAAFEQRLAEELGATQALPPADQARPVLAAVLATDLGYALAPGDDSKLGKWVRRHHEPLGKAQHGRYEVNVYPHTPALEDTIHAYFR